jgi:hypothetical protein
VCRNEITMCADGTPLSPTCSAKGCNICTVLPITCSSNSDCGTNGYVSNPECNTDDLYQNYRIYTCHNSGTSSSYCSHSDTYQKKSECGEDEYSSNYCYDNNVYRDFIDRGCSSGSCFEITTKHIADECGNLGCSSGQCFVPKPIVMPWLLLLDEE